MMLCIVKANYFVRDVIVQLAISIGFSVLCETSLSSRYVTAYDVM